MDHSTHQPHDQHSTAERGLKPETGGHGAHVSHDKHAGHDPDVFRRQFWVVLALTIPVVIWSEEVQLWLGYTAPVFPGSEWIPAIFGTIIFL
jgi:P-type Cu2+ transporter